MQYILMDYVGEAGWPQLTRAERSPTALHGVIEVRPVMQGTMLTRDIDEFIKPE